MSWAHAPVAGRRACRGPLPVAGTCRIALPRSAVAASLSAPGLAPLTGFSRSGGPSTLGWLAHRQRSATPAKNGPAKVLQPMYRSGTLYAYAGGTSICVSAPKELDKSLGGLSVSSGFPEPAL